MGAKQLKVAVLMGGPGREREVSLQSGASAAKALERAGCSVVPWDIGPDRLEILEDRAIDVFFVALHGVFGEDGQLQEVLEGRGLAYTGSGPGACRLAFDKLATKRCLEKAGLDTPICLEFTGDTDPRSFEQALRSLGPRVVVKPVRQGSSVGVHILDRPDAVLPVCRRTLAEFGDCMVEQFIAGTEVTVGVLLDRVLPLIEIRPVQGFYDYHAKYVDDQTQYLFDTLPPELERSVQAKGLQAFQALGLRHLGRIDFILSPEGRAYVLEANAIPGLTGHSLVPKAAAKVGLSMSDQCLQVAEAAHKGRR
ncbi:MAG: D-alanine--D-alanine ligase [Phycisphaerae bacterium]|nr:D-alanine--D-alanine ligase [Phycisphaerae bacterium]